MNVEQLVVALEHRAMDRKKVVVVQMRTNKLWEIGDVSPEHGLIVLKLWTPPSETVACPKNLWR